MVFFSQSHPISKDAYFPLPSVMAVQSLAHVFWDKFMANIMDLSKYTVCERSHLIQRFCKIIEWKWIILIRTVSTY